MKIKPLTRPTRIRPASLALAVLLFGALLGLGVLRGWTNPIEQWWYRASPDQPTVVLVVLDAVRADHLSLCGYPRPTSPTLAALRDRGARWSCNAIAPGSWTLPSHASFFTGVGVVEHGAHSLANGVAMGRNTAELVRPLGPELPTLAEQLAASGYQTVSLSGNPVVSPASGLTRGFDVVYSAEFFTEAYGRHLVTRLERILHRDVDRTGAPLFLFVNISDAHYPWLPIPRTASWVPARDWFDYDKTDTQGDWARFLRGEMSAEESSVLLNAATDAYDYGVYRADQTLAAVLATLEGHGWASAGLRVVVTSDHGEFLGERGLIDHGHYLWEPNQRVFLVSWDGEVAEPLPESPGPVPAMGAHRATLDGEWPAAGGPIEAVSFGHPQRTRWVGEGWFDSVSAAIWSDRDKLLWMDGEQWLLDPEQEAAAPADVAGHPLEGTLGGLADSALRSEQAPVELDHELLELLRAAGYVE